MSGSSHDAGRVVSETGPDDGARPAVADPAGARPPRSYGSGARILSIGIASTGLLTFAYFSIASHVLGEESAQRLDVLWSVMFVVISVIYRPIEQLLSRTIADRRARGQAEHSLRVPIAIQASFALVFLAVALALHDELVNHVFDGYSALYDVLVVGTLAYAASYFARGWLAGHKFFALYGGLVLMESVSRICFALAAALGITSGQTAVALGIAAAPFVSLVVVPAAFARRGGEQQTIQPPAPSRPPGRIPLLPSPDPSPPPARPPPPEPSTRSTRRSRPRQPAGPGSRSTRPTRRWPGRERRASRRAPPTARACRCAAAPASRWPCPGSCSPSRRS